MILQNFSASDIQRCAQREQHELASIQRDFYGHQVTKEKTDYLHLNAADEAETIKVYLSKQATPIAWRAKMDELIEEQGMTEEEAEQLICDSVFIMEMYYEKGRGLFLVESEACECTALIHSPYTCREYLDAE